MCKNGKGDPIQAIKVPGYSCTLSLASALEEGRVVSPTLRPLYPQERPGTPCTGGWICLGARLDSTENLTPTGIRSQDRPAIKAVNSPVSYQFTHGATNQCNSLYLINLHTMPQAGVIRQIYLCLSKGKTV
jgi:hypothetical protein